LPHRAVWDGPQDLDGGASLVGEVSCVAQAARIVVESFKEKKYESKVAKISPHSRRPSFSR